MIRVALALGLLAAVGLGSAMLWQHRRTLEARRELAQDRQPLWHGADVFHVVTFLQAAPGRDLLPALAALRDTLERAGDARLVYAGKVALDALHSSQLVRAFGEEVAWDAVVLVQHPSRADWERLSARDDWREALAGFARSYSHGMRRSPWTNLALPQLLLALRIGQLVTFAPSHFPFERASADERALPEDGRLDRLAAERELGGRAVVVVNLARYGTPEQQEADRRYARRMLGLMAEGGHGPLHLGGAVALSGDATYDHVALVFYPGVDYFADMARSRFYQGIVGDKQLGDTQASITVPLLERLDRVEPARTAAAEPASGGASEEAIR